jgi:diguanylate cyclase (GGDEF)-like protein
LEHLATTDPLTGLFNRRHFHTLAQFEFFTAREKSLPLTVVMLDLDHFKNVNDLHGHAIGDQVLIQLAATLNSTIRREDLCCRYGGEEFVLLLPQLNLESGLAIANRVREAIEDIEIIIGSHIVRVTVSAGVTTIRESDSNLNELIARADQALLKAKAAGRNIVMTAR